MSINLLGHFKFTLKQWNTFLTLLHHKHNAKSIDSSALHTYSNLNIKKEKEENNKVTRFLPPSHVQSTYFAKLHQ